MTPTDNSDPWGFETFETNFATDPKDGCFVFSQLCQFRVPRIYAVAVSAFEIFTDPQRPTGLGDALMIVEDLYYKPEGGKTRLKFKVRAIYASHWFEEGRVSPYADRVLYGWAVVKYATRQD